MSLYYTEITFKKAEIGWTMHSEGNLVTITIRHFGEKGTGKEKSVIVNLKQKNAIKMVAEAIESGYEYPFRILNFKYNGLVGTLHKGKADFKAKFIQWSGDPGVAKMKCSDGKIRYIPTYAIVGSQIIKITDEFNQGITFGVPSSSY